MNIAVIGAGKVGRALAASWVRAGHSVVFGVREPESEKSAPVRAEHGAQVKSIATAIESADVVVLAIPSSQTEPLVTSLHGLAGKVVFECSNPQAPSLHHNKLPETTLVERLEALSTGAYFVKIFNSVGFEVLGNPVFSGVAASMFFCSEHETATKVAVQLAADAGFEPIRLGALKQAGFLEELTRIWGALAYGAQMGRGLGFKILHRQEKS